MADNTTFLDASLATKTARAKDVGSGILANATVAVDEGGVLVSADDAAAAGPIFPVAGIYQSTVDEVDAGDIGRFRMSGRRAAITKPDVVSLIAFNNGGTGGAADGAIRSAANVDNYLSAFGSQKNRTIFIRNSMDTACTVTLIAWSNAVSAAETVYTQSVAAGGGKFLIPDAVDATAAASIRQLSVLKNTSLGDNTLLRLNAPGASGATTGFVAVELVGEE